MLKNSLYFLSLLLAFETLACNKTVNSKEVVLFIDTNQSEKEIVTAKKAACERGQRLISIPQDYSTLDPTYSDTRMSKAGVEVALAALKSQGAKPVSVIISGHDGGGGFGGKKGDVSRNDILDLMDSKFPEFKDSVQSLYLLGCYTGVKSEMFAWLSKLPNLKMIGGYEGAAPLSDKLAGHTYLEDLMLKEKVLTDQADDKRINDILAENIRNIQMLNSAVFVRSSQCVDGDRYKSYYYRPIPKIKGDPKFEELDKEDCIRKYVFAQDYLKEFSKYYDGSSNIPREVSAGNPLREIYNFFRNSDHCFDGMYNMPSSEQVLGILFYHNYKKSVIDYLQPDIKALKNQLDLLTPDSWKASIEKTIDEAKKAIKQEEDRFNVFQKDPLGTKASIQKKYDEIVAEMKRLNTNELDQAFRAAVPSPRQAELLNQYHKNLELEYRLASQLQDMQDANNYKFNYQSRINFMNENIQEQVSYLSQINQEAVDSVKKNIWTPTVDEIDKMERKEINDKINQYYSASTAMSHTLPLSLQNKISKVASSTNTYLNNMQCLPLSWHEYTPGNNDQPTCRAMGFGMGGGIGYSVGGMGSGGINDSPTGGGRATGDNSESFEEDDR
jgi:hypothetical protein